MQPFSNFRRTLYNNYLLYGLKIFIVLAGAVIFPMVLSGKMLLPPMLGAVAAGLTDLDDHLKGRVKNSLLIVAIFFTGSLLVELLFLEPIPFWFSLVIGTAGLIMLGALGQRFATIAFGTLVLIVYAMLTFNPERSWYAQPLMLVLGALWYNVVSLFFNAIWPTRPLAEALSECYRHLATFLEVKSQFFDPDEAESFQTQKLKLSQASKQLSESLDSTRSAIMRRLRNERGKRRHSEILSYYLVAQEIYERAASAHVEYEALHKIFLYSDVLFRFQRLMMQQGRAAQKISEALLHQDFYTHSDYFSRLFARLEETLIRLRHEYLEARGLIDSMRNLYRNLQGIDALFAKLEGESLTEISADYITQFTPEKLTFRESLWEMGRKFKLHLTPESEVFRHAVRMSFVMGVGYILVWIVNQNLAPLLGESEILPRTHWIVLTAIFVCQPNYSATKNRVFTRIWGTLLGVIATLAFLQLSPSVPMQVFVVILTGTLFFALRMARYAFATALITVMILVSFSLNDVDFVAPERMFDTIIGALLAWFAVSFILPDWHYRNIHARYEKVAAMNSAYLKEVQQQYHHGREDHLNYLMARERANSADGELSALFSALSVEKNRSPAEQEILFNNLLLNNNFLGYITALGAHRAAIKEPDVLALFDETVAFITTTLEHKSFDQPRYSALKRKIFKMLNEEEHQELSHIVLQQSVLLLRTLPRYLRALFNV